MLQLASHRHVYYPFVQRYGRNKMQFIRASRVDLYTQHSVDMWKDNLASLGFIDSEGLVFCNLAAISGPLRESVRKCWYLSQ